MEIEDIVRDDAVREKTAAQNEEAIKAIVDTYEKGVRFIFLRK